LTVYILIHADLLSRRSYGFGGTISLALLSRIGKGGHLNFTPAAGSGLTSDVLAVEISGFGLMAG
jgi:hypothetical protein